MLKADEALGSAFKTLKLGTMRIGKDGSVDPKMVAKFLSSRNFKIWSQHAVKINKDDPYGEMLKALTNVFGEKNVAMMILVGNLSRNSRDVAKKLEKAQFYKWYFVDKYKTADEVFTNVLKADRNRIHGYGREKEIWGDYANCHLGEITDSERQAVWESLLLRSVGGVLKHGEIRSSVWAAKLSNEFGGVELIRWEIE
ncbi:hypothetical protein PInf_006449 [Phytophthora infestans]|nr:hypothetical protein PInf_006449 [Phytophthora infestans]